MTEEEFVQRQIALGRRIHEHDGVFWEEVYPFYCKPAFIYKAFDPGEARPARLRSLLGWSHRVRTPERGNRTVAFMVMGNQTIRSFTIQALPTKKRNQVRRGLKSCSVRPLEAIEPFVDRIREINIAQAIRQEQGAGAETPARRYTDEADAWRAQVLQEFAEGGREWWGAFVEGVLAAYMRTYQLDGVRVIEQTKADTAYFKFYPMDALYFTVLTRAAGDETCRLVVNGRPLHLSLNHYKEQFLFKTTEFPYYSTHARLVELGKGLSVDLVRLRRSIYTRLHPRQGQPGSNRSKNDP